MRHGNLTQTTVLALTLTVVLAHAAFGGNLPQELAEKYLVNEDVNIITGLYTREYSLLGDKTVDYKTARQIIISEYNEYWNSVVETKEFPLFYWYDANHDGHFDIWMDQKVEGCSCDITPYQATYEQWTSSLGTKRRLP